MLKSWPFTVLHLSYTCPTLVLHFCSPILHCRPLDVQLRVHKMVTLTRPALSCLLMFMFVEALLSYTCPTLVLHLSYTFALQAVECAASSSQAGNVGEVCTFIFVMIYCPTLAIHLSPSFIVCLGCCWSGWWLFPGRVFHTSCAPYKCAACKPFGFVAGKLMLV